MIVIGAEVVDLLMCLYNRFHLVGALLNDDVLLMVAGLRCARHLVWVAASIGFFIRCLLVGRLELGIRSQLRMGHDLLEVAVRLRSLVELHEL